MIEAIRDILAWVFRPLTERHRGNLRLVAGCLLLSSILWIFNDLNRAIEAQISVPIKLHYDAKLFVPLAEIPKQVETVLRGNGWHMLYFHLLQKPNKVNIWIKHPSLHSRLDTSLIRHFLADCMYGVYVKNVKIDTTQLPFDRISHKQIRLKVDEATISLADGFVRDSLISISPELIVVSGPKTILAELEDTLMVSIPFQNIDKNFEESIRLTYFLNDTKLSTKNKTVDITFKVKKKSFAHVE